MTDFTKIVELLTDVAIEERKLADTFRRAHDVEGAERCEFAADHCIEASRILNAASEPEEAT